METRLTLEREALPLCVDVLGELRLRVDGRAVKVAGVRRRGLLALLALDAGRGISSTRLVESLWPDDPPENSLAALYNHVSRLRGQLGSAGNRLQRYDAGYRLLLKPDEVDADAARRLARAVESSVNVPSTAAELAQIALDLWRGPALDEFRSFPELETQSVHLDEIRLRLVDRLIEARLALGDPVVADAAKAAAAVPFRERTALLHIRALAVEGRTADAMDAAQSFRRRLADETGLDPGPDLAELEHKVAAGALIRPSADRSAPHAGALTVARPDGPLVGRRQDRDEITRLLSEHAIVTLTGPGGVGKTRLALEVVSGPATDPDEAAWHQHVVLVDLAAVERPDRVCQAVSSTLALRTTGPVQPDDVASALAERQLLIVLDNCEHVREACRDIIAAVRRFAPGVRFLATSRVTLHTPGEHVVRLQPLPVPRDGRDLDAFRRQPSVRAFLEHARMRRADFDLSEGDAPDLIEILQRLDGLPLGIELAARQVAIMPLSALRERLDRALDIGTGAGSSADARQRTLRATIRSSYHMLDVEEQKLLLAMAPFPGGVDLATMEALVDDLDLSQDPLDILLRLIDTSLVAADRSTGRYRLLFTVRTFLLDELREVDQLERAEQRFLDRCLEICGEIGTLTAGPGEAVGDRRLRLELDNLRAARDLSVSSGRNEMRVAMTLHLEDAATWRDLRELWTWALELADDPQLTDHPQHGALLGHAAEAARLTGDLDLAIRLADEALAAAKMRGLDPQDIHRALSARASVAHFRGDFDAARDDWLLAAEHHPSASGALVASAALAAAYSGKPDNARALLARAHEANSQSKVPSHAAFVAYVEGELRTASNTKEAVPYYLEAIQTSRETGASFVEGVARVSLASARIRLGDVAGAASGFAYLLGYWRRTGHVTQLWTTARNAANLLGDTGHSRIAALLLICADADPGAAAVGPEIAQFSGRRFTRAEDLVPLDELTDLRTEVAEHGSSPVLDAAVRELDQLARHQPD
ncbi:BTAD domain-containing putative transcriptional regulator [soil metagenome]